MLNFAPREIPPYLAFTGIQGLLSKSLNLNINVHVLLTILRIFFMVTSWRNLIRHPYISSLGLVSFILLTCLFDQVRSISLETILVYHKLVLHV